MPEQSKVMMQDPTDDIPSWLDGEIPLSDNALTVLHKRYLRHGPDGEPAETPNADVLASGQCGGGARR